ncbi:hypothetical protein H8A97_22965 [Bradyrhizobium sp. Arg62]|uniref:hypothetical protein n=1 Tax=Bradyrhizobium TaxID=374 RepID=UPI001E4673F6|nr:MULTISPECIES: hypothetical protein [Bradyrhizobium]MCC8937931.1 hypothetical protein [Bradyrhizobium ivorense]MCC8947890.1 hypothetical protein [Bradyrhizobium brasilense]
MIRTVTESTRNGDGCLDDAGVVRLHVKSHELRHKYQDRLQAMFGSMPRQLTMPSARELEMMKQAMESPAVKVMQALFKKD